MIRWFSTRWNSYRASRELKAAHAAAETVRTQLRDSDARIDQLQLDVQKLERKVEAKDGEIEFLNDALQSSLLKIRAMSMVHGQNAAVSVEEIKKSFPKVAG